MGALREKSRMWVLLGCQPAEYTFSICINPNTFSICWNKLAQKIASELDDPIHMWKVYIIIFELNFPNPQVLDKINTFYYNLAEHLAETESIHHHHQELKLK